MGDIMDQNEIDKLLEEFSEEEKQEAETSPAPQPEVKGAELLSQEEIDALLQGLEEGEIAAEEEAPEEVPAEAFEPFDFRKWELLELEKTESLKLIFDRFSKQAGFSLREFLHIPVAVDLSQWRAVYFEDFIRKVPLPTGLIILRVEPVRTSALLVLDARTVFYAIDVLLGGGRRGRVKVEGRDFTPIETRIIRHISNILLQSLKMAWEPVYPLEFHLEKIELSPELAAASFERVPIVVADFDVDFGGAAGSFSLCLPSGLVKAFRDRMAEGTKVEVGPEDPQWRSQLIEALKEVPVSLEVEFVKVEVTASELLKLKEGDVFFIPSSPEEELVVKVQGIPLLKGKAGVSRGRRAVKITALL